MARWKTASLAIASVVVISGLLVVSSPKANYVWKAYFYPGSDANLRGYPTIEPPNGFTGTWVHYTFTGRALAMHTVVDGHEVGKQIYFRDDGAPYLVRYLNIDEWERDDVNLGPPAATVIPWLLPQRWINRSLDRLAFLDKLFPPQPTVFTQEAPSIEKKEQQK
jgi:hypothetical protein